MPELESSSQRSLSRKVVYGAISGHRGVTTTSEETSERIRVRVLRNLLEIEDVRSTWTAWQRHLNADIDFYVKIMASRPEFVRPHVIVVDRIAFPEAILIGRVEHRVLDLRIGYGRVFKPKVRLLAFGYGGLLGNPSPAGSAALVREILHSLRDGEADVAFFNHLRTDSPLYAQVVRLSGALGRDYFPDLGIHRSMALPKRADQFYSGLSPKVRKNQRWQARKFLQDHPGQVRVACLRETAELDQVFRDVEEVAKNTYQRGLGVGFADTPEMRQRLCLLADKGWLRTYILYVCEKPCAFWMGTLYKDTFHSDFMGYDPAYARHSPGMFLIMKVIENLCDHQGLEDIEEIDFGLGDAQYKEMLGNRDWLDASVYMFAPSIKGIGLNLLRTPLMALDRTARRTLERTRLVGRMKRLWRGMVQPDGAHSSRDGSRRPIPE